MVSMTGLTLRFERDDDGDVRLYASLRVGGFAGEGKYRCSPSEFAYLIDDLEQFPISPEQPIEGEWAAGIRLAIVPLGTTGLLEVRASVSDYSDVRTRCDAIFHCHYADLAAFRAGLLDAGPLGNGEASLSAS